VRKISAKPLEELAISTKADCLRSVWPLVEKKLASGTSHADVLRALNEGGFDLTERTYKSYVYRLRKELRDASACTSRLTPQARPQISGWGGRPPPPVLPLQRESVRAPSTMTPAAIRIY
jgi:hypothetical protein